MPRSPEIGRIFAASSALYGGARTGMFCIVVLDIVDWSDDDSRECGLGGGPVVCRPVVIEDDLGGTVEVGVVGSLISGGPASCRP